MATKQKATQYALDATRRTGNEYVIVQRSNGQWLYATKAFYDSPAGRLSRGARKYETVQR